MIDPIHRQAALDGQPMELPGNSCAVWRMTWEPPWAQLL